MKSTKKYLAVSKSRGLPLETAPKASEILPPVGPILSFRLDFKDNSCWT
mgnify:CR=1 FL=1